MPDTARNIRGWPWRDVFEALMGLLGGYAVSLRLSSSGWNLVGGYALFAALFLMFALFRSRRALCLGAFVGLTGGVVYLVLFVTG